MADAALQKAIDKLMASLRILPRHVIATIYGDILFPYHRPIWLGSLVAMTEPFGIAEFLSRTTALRMAKVGWLDTIRVGRLSYYAASEALLRGMAEHYDRVYSPPESNWSGSWSLFLTGSAKLGPKAYTSLRRGLLGRGIGQVAPHVFISASVGLASIEDLLAEHGIAGKVQVLEASPKVPSSLELMRTIVASAWDLEAVEKDYETFLGRFRPVWTLLDRHKTVAPEQGYMIRTLLINEYRRLALRDPRLPSEFLPPVWAGNMAYTLTRNIYQSVLEASSVYVRDVVRTPDGPLPGMPAEVTARFGGLDLG